jgi:predicted nucleotidyltransferase
MSRTVDWGQTQTIWEGTSTVVAAWAFGSAQDGALREGSDADIAVLTEGTLTFEQQLDLLGRLQDALQLDKVDLVILNDANPILRFEAVSGRQLFNRDPEEVAGFVSLTAREYEDEMAQWERAMANHRRANP